MIRRELGRTSPEPVTNDNLGAALQTLLPASESNAHAAAPVPTDYPGFLTEEPTRSDERFPNGLAPDASPEGLEAGRVADRPGPARAIVDDSAREFSAGAGAAGHRSYAQGDQSGAADVDQVRDADPARAHWPVGADRRPTSGAGLDWSLVNEVRSVVSARLAKEVRESVSSAEDEIERGRVILREVLDDLTRDDYDASRRAWSAAEDHAIFRAVDNALFRLGRLQPLLDLSGVENIEINGYDNVLVQFADGRVERREPVAESDADLVDFISFVASRSRHSPRPFSEANPRLHLRLDDGQRMAAVAWITPRPIVVIRVHRLVDVSMQGLVGRQMLSANAASFLSAAVRAHKSIVVVGAQGAGKTTFTRALAAEIPAEESIGTFETELELFLQDLDHWIRPVKAWEARPGSGEFAADGTRAGEISLTDCLADSFRFNLTRQIVGEIRGAEVLAMIKAMESSNGSLSTTHARSARLGVAKLVTCAMEQGPQITRDYARRSIAGSVDLLVYIRLDHADEYGRPIRRRVVTEIVAIEATDEPSGAAFTDVYRMQNGGLAPYVLPDDYRELAGHGFDLHGYLSSGGQSEEDRG